MTTKAIDWTVVPLGDLVEHDSPITYGVVKPGVEGDVPFIRGGDIVSGRILEGQLRTISAEVSKQYRRTLLRGGEVLVSLVGNPGQVAIAAQNLCGANIARQVGLVRLRRDVDSRFVAYFLRSPAGQEAMGARSLGSVQQVINLKDLKQVTVRLPALELQQAIAAILGSLDDKIELNRRMNATLEAMARALFQSWFVDFDPVRAKMDGRQPVGMDAETAALFPEELDFSSGAMAPKGWSVAALPDVIEVNPSRSLRKGSVAPYLDMKNVPTVGHAAESTIARPFGSGTKFQHGDTLVARITPCLENGKTCYVDFLEDSVVGWGSTEFIVLNPKPPLPKQFGYLLARSDGFRSHCIQNMTGTSGRQRVPPSCLANIQLAVPDRDVALAFGNLTESLIAKVRENSGQNKQLAALRDTLLPKLLSGELSVDAAAEMVA